MPVLERLTNDRSQCYGRPLKPNNATIKDLVNNNYQVEYLQGAKLKEESYHRNVEEIMLRIRQHKQNTF